MTSGWAKRPARSWASQNGTQYPWRKFRREWFATHPHDCVLAYQDICLGVGNILDHKDGCDYDVDRCNPDWIQGIVCAPCHHRKTTQQSNRAHPYRAQGTPSRDWF